MDVGPEMATGFLQADLGRGVEVGDDYERDFGGELLEGENVVWIDEALVGDIAGFCVAVIAEEGG